MTEYLDSVARVESLVEEPLEYRAKELREALEKMEGIFLVRNPACVKDGKANYAVFIPMVGGGNSSFGFYAIYCTNDYEIFRRASELVLFSGLSKECVFCTQISKVPIIL